MTCSASIGAGTLFHEAVKMFAGVQCILGNPVIQSHGIQNGDTFDFIIVGAGSAGCVLVNRLTEVSHLNILLVEAGSDQPIESNIPKMQSTLMGSKYDWNYVSQNDNYSSQSLRDKRVKINRGKMLGGCSSINKMFFLRGHPYDYQQWSDLGNIGWDPQTVTKYFNKAESVSHDHAILKYSKVYFSRGFSGPIKTTKPSIKNGTAHQLIVDSFIELGFDYNPDFNTFTPMGVGLVDTNIYEGIRESTATAYLNPISNRKKFHLALATKLLCDNAGTVIGIQVITEYGEPINLYSRNEVILSTGAINTPKILKLSG